MDVLTITNASALKAAVSNDRKAALKTTAYKGAALSLAPGVAAALASLLGLPEGSLPEALAFATADVTLYSAIAKKK
jgi:2-methylcitrate dehydratase PrpD